MAELNVEKIAKSIAYEALEMEYKGKTLRYWIDELERMEKCSKFGELQDCKNCGYKIHSEAISKLNSCNNCLVYPNCLIAPRLGAYCRINCYCHVSKE